MTKQQYLTLTDIKVDSSYSTEKGGFLYANEPLGTETVTIEIKKSLSNLNLFDIQTVRSGQDGGIFYLDSK